ncbi:hypothetical protein ACKZDW_02230 (plasmid) [Ralstonia syzygii subsp. celebesensis]
MSQSPEFKATMNMTAQTLGKDLLSALVLELKMLPDTWPKLSQKKQDDIIERLRSRVDASVKMAVHLIAANGRTVVQGDLDKITIKDGAQALIKIGKSATALHDLAESQGKAVLLVLSGDESAYTSGMDEVQGNPTSARSTSARNTPTRTATACLTTMTRTTTWSTPSLPKSRSPSGTSHCSPNSMRRTPLATRLPARASRNPNARRSPAHCASPG